MRRQDNVKMARPVPFYSRKRMMHCSILRGCWTPTSLLQQWRQAVFTIRPMRGPGCWHHIHKSDPLGLNRLFPALRIHVNYSQQVSSKGLELRPRPQGRRAGVYGLHGANYLSTFSENGSGATKGWGG